MATFPALFATSLSNRATVLLTTVERSDDDNADSPGFIAPRWGTDKKRALLLIYFSIRQMTAYSPL